jgi:BASS family bile acid:Na+ symporter
LSPLDQAVLKFSPESLVVLNFALGFLMFAVSLFIEGRDFVSLRERPRGIVAGLTMQWLALPLLAVGLIWLIEPHPGIALGMLLVAACPGGNVSNYLNLLARANVALSIGLTTVSTVLAPFMTPLLFFLGAQLAAGGAPLPALSVDLGEMITSVLGIVALPLAAGQLLKRKAPAFTGRIRKPMRIAAGLVLVGFIVAALANNLEGFRDYAGAVAWIIVLHNALTLACAYLVALAFAAPEPDRRAVTIESGIHNAGLGLFLVFNFFDGNGPMALIVAGWGVWHLVTGGALALWWSRRDALSASAPGAPAPRP